MSGAETPQAPVPPDSVDEFDWIARDLRPLAAGAPEAFDLLDDAAAIPSRPGFDLIVSKDAIVEGVHFLPDDPMDLVARKLLRVNLSDLAAKGAEPYGYFLAVAWPGERGRAERAAFVAGLRADQDAFGVHLLGGDTVSTPGPFTASLTILGWAPGGRMVRRAMAKPGDVVLVTGTIGDGGLGLAAARSELAVPDADAAWLADRYRLPQPRLGLGEPLRRFAHAAADVSDGLIADAGRIGVASQVGLDIDLGQIPLSPPAKAWLAAQPDRAAGLVRLATAGDDYEVICAAPGAAVSALTGAVAARGLALTVIGRVTAGSGVRASLDGAPVAIASAGYRHR
jgi:thiamine-monophosphate kinase